MATNVSDGSHFTDGVRVGPVYTAQLPTNLSLSPTGQLISGANQQWGPGVLLSPISTLRVTPAVTAGVGFTKLNNLVAQTVDGQVNAAMNLTLRGDNNVTFYQIGNNGLPEIQFDLPRVPTITIAGADATAGTEVTIFGEDKYSNPLQHTVVVQAQGNYPDFDDVDVLASKAMYLVNRVYINAALPVNCLISLGASEAFGLPYYLGGLGRIAYVEWEKAEASNDCIIAIGDDAVPSPITGDIRGWVHIPTASAADNQRQLIFGYYQEGADQQQNIDAGFQQQYLLNPQNAGKPTQGVPITSLRREQMYGHYQYYTGVPGI